MANDSLPQMNGWEKRDFVENTLKTGDATAANSALSTVQDQKLFMELLASKADTDNLPGLHISADKDGHVHEIKTDKLTISDADGHLTAHSNNPSWGEYFQAKWNSVTSFGSGSVELVKDYGKSTTLGDCLATSATAGSCENRRLDAQIEKATGKN